MTVSTTRQATQAKVLMGMRLRPVHGPATAEYLGSLFGLTRQQVAAALMLLEGKGLVQRVTYVSASTRWFVTVAGYEVAVK